VTVSGADRRPSGATTAVGVSPNALVVLAAFLGLGLALAMLTDPPRVLAFLFVVCGWVASVMVHEFGHAYVAYRGGDHTVVERGYLTLDPLKYSDLQLSLVLPILALVLGGIGFPGGAVYLRMDLIRSRIGRSLASLAGPAGTFVVLLVLAAVLWAAPLFGPRTMFFNAVAFLAFIQATALIINLLPVPGLDGYGVVRPFLPNGLQRGLRRIEGLAIWLLLAALFFIPGVSDDLFHAAFDLCARLGIPHDALAIGWSDFRFWQPEQP